MGSAPGPGRFTLGKETRYPLYRTQGGLQGQWVKSRAPPPGIRSTDRQPVASRYTDYAVLAHKVKLVSACLRESKYKFFAKICPVEVGQTDRGT